MRDTTPGITETLVMEKTTNSPVILRAAVSIDCVVLRFNESRLSILLLNENDPSLWSLPGRMMESDENARETASKLVHQYTEENKPYLDQVYTFTDVTKHQPHPAISITYVALVKDSRPHTGKTRWFFASELPSLMQNYREKIFEAMNFVKRKATYDPFYFHLLAEKFTLPQLRKLFEEIYGETFDQRNFNKKFKALGLLIKLNEKETSQSKKGAFYHMFDREKYYQMERPVLKFAHLLY